MRRTLVVVGALMVLALPASASDCVQSDGQVGVQLVGIEGDAGCQTAEEYQQVFSAPNLAAIGVIHGYTVNADGTTSLDFGDGMISVVPSNPLDQKVAANPAVEDAPTVREVLFDQHPGSGGLQEF